MGTSSDVKALKTQLAALTARVAALEAITLPPVTAPPVVVDPPPVTPPVVVGPGSGTGVPIPPKPIYRYPADLFGLNWKVTLESGSDIAQPKLATYSDANFRLNEAGTGVQMRVHFGGGTTPNSNNPRCELREMTPDGMGLASWSTTSGRHSLRTELTVDALAASRPHSVLSQIHNDSDDVTVFRLEGSSLWLTNANSTHGFNLTDSFEPGRHVIGFDVENGVVSYFFDGMVPSFTLKSKATGCYFKAGTYLQANSKTDPSGKTSEYSQVTLYKVTVTHS